MDFRGNRPSIARRLTLGYSISLAVILGSAGIFLFQSLERSLDLENQYLLEDREQAIVSLLQRDPSLKLLKRRVESEWAYHRLEKTYVQVTNTQKTIVTETPSVPGWARTLAFDSSSSFITGKVNIRRLDSENNTHLLLLTKRIENPASYAGWTIFAAVDLEREQELLARYKWRIGFTIAVSFLFSIALGKWIAYRGLAPVKAMALSMSQINSTDLSQRVSVNLPLELEILGRTFNELLDKIQSSMEKLTQFSADIAHELRNPIHNIRGEIEVALGRSREPKAYQEVLSSCLEECARLKSIVDSLLFLARTESNPELLKSEQLNLRQEMENLVEFYEASAEESKVELVLALPEEILLLANRSLVQSAISNLLSNAIRHTQPGGRVTLSASREPSMVIIQVSDNGRGISSTDLPRVFDRFYRADQQRSSTGEHHFGLGLSIVQAILQLHHGQAEIESTEERGTVVKLIFPQKHGTVAVFS